MSGRRRAGYRLEHLLHQPDKATDQQHQDEQLRDGHRDGVCHWSAPVCDVIPRVHRGEDGHQRLQNATYHEHARKHLSLPRSAFVGPYVGQHSCNGYLLRTALRSIHQRSTISVGSMP